MKIQFLGIKNQVKKSGCSSCGSRQVSKHTFQRETRMVLPSGQTKTFYVGEVSNVMDQDGHFLLNQTYTLDGQTVKMFKEGQ
ncbi:hypothetical protein [Candidatus Enterococcus mansonii]|uniref:Uncharacterized protein n=1 Tax=Candidatus Enterococcus mansonii TaxID=1834181 RepID=A0A242CE26_9ENTE|nr:hypothetical protein [Enterococcus sp. 4G2_DIV0659]OTO08493.1 hypothetical protein A5880_001493 [Enterococcus sp. 4G2_DIV0659]